MLIFFGALIGVWVGGWKGLLFGAALGFLVSRVALALTHRGLKAIEVQFLESTFAVMGALCKADGVVTRDEIRVIERIFGRLNLTAEQKETAKAAFTRGKAPDFDLDTEVNRFVGSAGRGRALFELFLQLQVTAMAADGAVHPAEHAMLLRVARGLGLEEATVVRLEALLRAVAGGVTERQAPAGQQLNDAYAVLGIPESAPEDQIKRAYRKLMRENHPDKLASKGLPQGMRAIAEERARQINQAYELIRQARQFR